jgi:hypothetical protein
VPDPGSSSATSKLALPLLGETLTDFQRRPTLAELREIGANLAQLLRRKQCPLRPSKPRRAPRSTSTCFGPACPVVKWTWGFRAFEMPDGQEFIASFYGDDGFAEIDVVERHESLGSIEDKADWLGLTGEVSFPVGATKK